MHVHILGICGTFMGGVAALAKAMGHRVTGSDQNVYPPMSTQLEALGITLYQGWDEGQFAERPDVVVIGNALSRGNPAVEHVLNHDLPYTSGAQWLAEHVTMDRWRIAVAGTHGKTTSASMLAWVLEFAGMNPGFLIGGVPNNFAVSARLGDAPFFVIEADEYDTAFFDKRSKFVHYHPRTAIINNLEYDHADIFPDLAAIQKQFHHLVRTIPQVGLLIHQHGVPAIDEVLRMGCWTETESFGEGGLWRAELLAADGSEFNVSIDGRNRGTVRWTQLGLHNVNNALAVLAAARHAGVRIEAGIEALCEFGGVKRRMELRGEVRGVRVFDDFAHHPTAILTTLQGAKRNIPGRVIAVLEPRSNTMKLGVHKKDLAASLQPADEVHVFQPANIGWPVSDITKDCAQDAFAHDDLDDLVSAVAASATRNDAIVVMSNGGFGNVHEKLLRALDVSQEVVS